MPEMNSEREKLIKELRNEHIKHQRLQFIGQEPNDGYSGLADWVLSDRQRILAPLVELKSFNYDADVETIENAIDATLRLAGLTTEKGETK